MRGLNRNNKLTLRRRRLRRRRFQRRKKFLKERFSSVAPEFLSPRDARDLLVGSAAAARRAINRINRGRFTGNFINRPDSTKWQPNPTISKIARPGRTLSRLNRSTTFPPIVPREVNLKFFSAAEIIADLKRRNQDKKLPSHVLLDALAKASGLSFDCAAQLLVFSQLIEQAISQNDIQVVWSGRQFWKRFCQGQSRYHALSQAEAVPHLSGNWAYLDADELENLLPGIIVPTRLKRRDYLANYICDGGDYSLDIYSRAALRPLLRHPFPVRFNPPVFRKPLGERLADADSLAA